MAESQRHNIDMCSSNGDEMLFSFQGSEVCVCVFCWIGLNEGFVWDRRDHCSANNRTIKNVDESQISITGRLKKTQPWAEN